MVQMARARGIIRAAMTTAQGCSPLCMSQPAAVSDHDRWATARDSSPWKTSGHLQGLVKMMMMHGGGTGLLVGPGMEAMRRCGVTSMAAYIGTDMHKEMAHRISDHAAGSAIDGSCSVHED